MFSTLDAKTRSPTGKPSTILQSTISDDTSEESAYHSPTSFNLSGSPRKETMRDLSWSSVTSPPDGNNYSMESNSDVPLSPERDSVKHSPRGPRIKHVCRKSSIALGKRALFSDPESPLALRLSALPAPAKQKLLEKQNSHSQG